jgi:hypothetical protein
MKTLNKARTKIHGKSNDVVLVVLQPISVRGGVVRLLIWGINMNTNQLQDYLIFVGVEQGKTRSELSLQLQILPVAKAAMSGVDFLLSRLMN